MSLYIWTAIGAYTGFGLIVFLFVHAHEKRLLKALYRDRTRGHDA